MMTIILKMTTGVSGQNVTVCYVCVQCMKETGTIVAIPQSSVIRVQYEDARMWSVVRSVLSRVSTDFLLWSE